MREVIIIQLTESLFSLNKFGTPKTVTDNEAIYTLITRLLLLEPGTFQTHPEMGVGIVSRYRYSFEGAARDLKADIDAQIQQYLPELQGVDVQVTDTNNNFTIDIVIDGVLYDFSFNSKNGTLEGLITM